MEDWGDYECLGCRHGCLSVESDEGCRRCGGSSSGLRSRRSVCNPFARRVAGQELGVDVFRPSSFGGKLHTRGYGGRGRGGSSLASSRAKEAKAKASTKGGREFSLSSVPTFRRSSGSFPFSDFGSRGKGCEGASKNGSTTKEGLCSGAARSRSSARSRGVGAGQAGGDGVFKTGRGHDGPLCGDYQPGSADRRELGGSNDGSPRPVFIHPRSPGLGRAKLQQELAAHRGTFFNSVVMSMARRMSPTMPADQPHGELLAAGISGVRYLERFGGYGRQRELGILQFNIMTAFDFLMAGNVEAAKDSIALTAVMVEQASMDHGRFDLAQVLTFQEDPPSSIFMTRATSQVSRSRAFAPLADQRWITVSLAFLRELDTITTKRAELVGGSQPSSNPNSAAVPKPKQPGSPKKKGGGRGNQRQTGEEEEAQ